MNQDDRQYKNDEITVFWKPDLCNHSEICFKNLPRVFNPKRRPWVKLDASNTEKIIEVVNMCPSSALTFKYNDDSLNKPVPQYNFTEIKVIKNGPFYIKGNLKIYDSEGKLISEYQKLSLCRCGASKKMPFCDGNHKNINFIG